MARSALPKPPTGLGAPGRRLWRRILGDIPVGFELDGRELHSLERACRCADEIAVLEASIDDAGVTVRGSRGQPVVNRALEEVRMMRLTEARLLASIRLDPETVASATSTRARRAAQTRWSLERGRNLRAVAP